MRRSRTALTDEFYDPYRIAEPAEEGNHPRRGKRRRRKSKRISSLARYQCFDILPCAAITDGTAAHADLHLLHLGGRKIILSREQCNNAEKLIEMGFDVQVLDTPLGDKYPADVSLNAALFGNYAILNPKTVCKNIDFSGRSLIPVRQGYTKCSVVPVTESAIITDDVSIASAAEKTDLLYCSSQRAMSPCPGANMALSAAAAGSLRPIQCYSTARFRFIGTAKKSEPFSLRSACVRRRQGTFN